MRKFILIGVALMIMGIFTACQSDEPTPMDKASENVAGTKWLGYFSRISYELYFYSDGKYEFRTSEGGFQKGMYHQSGTTIQFTKTSEFFFYYSVHAAHINTPGIMTMDWFYYDGSKAGNVKFALDVLNK